MEALFLLIFLLSTQIFAQEPIPLNKERPLAKVRVGDPIVEPYRCGAYFIYHPKPKHTIPAGPRLSYLVEKLPGDPEGTSLFVSFLREKFDFVIEKKKPVPTAEMRFNQDGTMSKIVVRLNNTDFDLLQLCFTRKE